LGPSLLAVFISQRLAWAYAPLPPSLQPLLPPPRADAGLGAAAPLAFILSSSARQEKNKEKAQEEAGVQLERARGKDTNQNNVHRDVRVLLFLSNTQSSSQAPSSTRP
jgi:hypothetical protein